MARDASVLNNHDNQLQNAAQEPMPMQNTFSRQDANLPTTLPVNAMSGHQAMMDWNVAPRTSHRGRSTRQRPQHHGSAGQRQVLLAGYATSCWIE